MGVGFKKPLWIVFLVVRRPQAGLCGLVLESAVFFRYKGGLKMAAASPRCWGRGAVSYFAVALLRRLAAAILGWRAWRAARGTKWRRSRAPMQAGAAPHKAAWGG